MEEQQLQAEGMKPKLRGRAGLRRLKLVFLIRSFFRNNGKSQKILKETNKQNSS